MVVSDSIVGGIFTLLALPHVSYLWHYFPIVPECGVQQATDAKGFLVHGSQY